MIKKYAVQIILCALCVVLIFTFYSSLTPSPKDTVRFSVVLYGDSESRWVSLEQGMRQACGELSLVPSISSKDNVEEQINAIQREFENGTEGIIVAAAGSERLAEYLATLPSDFPIILAETGASKTYPAVSGSDTEMGHAVAQSLFDEGIKNAALLDTVSARESVAARQAAFLEKSSELSLTITVLQSHTEGEPATSFLKGELNSAIISALVALDNERMEESIAAVTETKAATKIYGIGSSAKIIQALDDGIVSAVCFQNEFNIGYISVFELAQKMGEKVNIPQTTINHVIVHKENMYSPEIERLIFPVIQ